jgi:hypothetical protein
LASKVVIRAHTASHERLPDSGHEMLLLRPKAGHSMIPRRPRPLAAATSMQRARRYRRWEPRQAAPPRMTSGQTSSSAVPASNLTSRPHDCSERLRRSPSRPPHEREQGILPRDAMDTEPCALRSCGRPVVVFYNGARTHLSLNKDAPVPRAVQAIGRILPTPNRVQGQSGEGVSLQVRAS